MVDRCDRQLGAVRPQIDTLQIHLLEERPFPSLFPAYFRRQIASKSVELPDYVNERPLGNAH